MGCAILLTALIGASRVFLGVHYPSDVAGGWCAGTIWALSCWMVGRRFAFDR
ncbi:MAG: phosphatase PAP2 family protein [Shinella sp.]|uniref:phosphatase PAP2 family protein n=1 Tax=Shinella sp. TaxID=1870904 RepID=UPI0040356AB5